MPGLQTPPARAAAGSCPRLGASHGRKNRPGAGWCCQHRNPGLAAPARLGTWFCHIRQLRPLYRESARGCWCQRPCERVGVGFGVRGEPWLGDAPGFSFSGGSAREKRAGLGGSGQTEEMEGGAASAVGLTGRRGARLRQAQQSQV